MNLYPLVYACLFESSTLSMYIGHSYRNVPVVSGIAGFIVVVGSRLGIPGAHTSVVVVVLFKPLLQPVKSPRWEVTGL